ncbi:hypothetical protein GOV09_02785 [Candidatus Woesearchaeota archaeon]|nr:hypothetical protein [Candidatus Woesearchaeota archaeon]
MALVFVKFLLWIVVFALFYASLKKVLHDNNRLVGVIAFIMALIGVALMPNSIVLIIFKLYGWLVAALLILLPVAFIWFFNKKVFGGKKWEGWLKGIVYVFLAMLLLFFAAAIDNSSGSLLQDIEAGYWIKIAAVVLLFLGLIAFFEGTGSLVKGHGADKAPLWVSKKKADSESEKESAKARDLAWSQKEYLKWLMALEQNALENIGGTVKDLKKLKEIIEGKRKITTAGLRQKNLTKEQIKEEIIKAIKKVGKKEGRIQIIDNRLQEAIKKIEKLIVGESKHLSTGFNLQRKFTTALENLRNRSHTFADEANIDHKITEFCTSLLNAVNRTKAEIDTELIPLANALKTKENEFLNSLESCAQAVEGGDNTKAIGFIDLAIRAKNNQEVDFRRLIELETQLSRYLSKEISKLDDISKFEERLIRLDSQTLEQIRDEY